MNYADDGYVYDNDGYCVGSHDVSQLDEPNGKKGSSLTFFLILGVIIAFCERGTKWIDAVRNYFLRFLHHPVNFFHLENLIFLFFICLIGYPFIKRIF